MGSTTATMPTRRTGLVVAMALAAMLLIFATLATFSGPSLGFPASSSLVHKGASSGSLLASLALRKVLKDASPIFGDPSTLLGAENTSEPKTATWMKAYHDETKIVHMNLPGTHDAATWNYSHSTQDSLEYINGLANISAQDPANYKCQSKSLIQMLNAGIRVFDLRYAFDVTRTNLVFWHGNALQSETATVEDVLYAFYLWLDHHPSEALFLSFQHENGANDAQTQLALYQILTSPSAQSYIVQARGQLDTLGHARGKITLLKRFDLDLLPDTYEDSIPGLHFSPLKWTDDGDNIELVYNSTSGSTAYIEDYYHPSTPSDSTAAENIQWKLNATEAHLNRAASNLHTDSLFWGFASSTKTNNEPPLTPQILALGNGTLTPQGGVNQQLVSVLQGMSGKRLGIMMFDFFEEPQGFLELFLSLLRPDEARNYGL